MCLITTRYIGLVIHISFSVIITVLLLSVFLSIKEVNHERIRKTSFGRVHFGTVLDSRPDRVYLGVHAGSDPT